MKKRNVDKLADAIRSLQDTLAYARSSEFQRLDIEFKNIIQAAVVQNFGLTFRLCLRMIEYQLRDFFGAAEVTGRSPESLLHMADKSGVIADVNRWLEYLDCEHLSQSSTIAVRTFEKAGDFLQDARLLLTTCTRRSQNERRCAA